MYWYVPVYTSTNQYIPVYTDMYWFMLVYTGTYYYNLHVVPVLRGCCVCRTRTPLLWSLHILTASQKILPMFLLKTVGMNVPSSSSSATCVLLADGSLRTCRTKSALMTSCTTWSFSARLRSLTCPSMDRWRMLGSSNCTSFAPYSAFMWLQLTTW